MKQNISKPVPLARYKSELEEKFANTIIKRRKELVMSQKQLARETNLSQSNISDIELQKRSPSLYTIEKICKTLKIEIDFTDKSKNSIKNHLN